MSAQAQKTHPLHVHKWDTFLSVIFEDAALRVDDRVHCGLRGPGIVKEVFFGGKGNQCLIDFFMTHGPQLHRREDLELNEKGHWVAKPLGHGKDKRVRHDKELRELMDAQVWARARR